MKTRWSALLVIGLLTASAAQAQIKGAGSTFAANLYASWNQSIAKPTGGRVDYEPVGSSGGVKALQERSVDFAASDRPLPRQELEAAGLAQFPTAIGGVVIISNVPGVPADKLKLDAAALGGIYTGAIKQWNDPALRALNPELALPAAPIVPIFRSDGSGTSFVFSTYLSKLHATFKSSYGVTSSLKIPFGKGGRSSGEVLQLVRETAGAIAYIDYAVTIDLGLPTAQLRNQWGKFVVAGAESLQYAMRAADWEKILIDQEPTFELDLTDAGCPACWPIATATYVLVPIRANNANSYRVLEFFDQSLQKGDEIATKEGYVPLPNRAKNMVSIAMRRWQTALERAGAGKPQRRSGIEHESPQTPADTRNVHFAAAR